MMVIVRFYIYYIYFHKEMKSEYSAYCWILFVWCFDIALQRSCILTRRSCYVATCMDDVLQLSRKVWLLWRLTFLVGRFQSWTCFRVLAVDHCCSYIILSRLLQVHLTERLITFLRREHLFFSKTFENGSLGKNWYLKSYHKMQFKEKI